MVKPELGVKRVCGSCGAKFYDLNRDPILCPKCGTVFDVQAALKPRRVKAVAEDKPVKAKKPVRAVDPDEADLPEDVIDDETDTDDEEEEGVIEDTSELGEDDDDVAEVIEKVDDGDDR
ncbi:MAG TPA: TIGR02300 family protein [Alphaproteobacteria bacterium]